MKTWQRLHQNKSLWNKYFIRQQVIDAVRQFFKSQKFHEIETPILTPYLPQESYIEVFETTLLSRNRKAVKAYLPTSPEPFLKKLIVAGAGNCFTITKSFRNTEGQSSRHSPEFTILEWYQVEADYGDVMKCTESLIQYIHRYLLNCSSQPDGLRSMTRTYQGIPVDLSSPWQKMSISQAFEKYAQISQADLVNESRLSQIVRKKGYATDSKDTLEIWFNQIFLNEIEPNLPKKKPVILYDYPAQMAALSRKKSSDPRFAERFEFYIGGLEMGDSYSELTDWKEQQQRFSQEKIKRRQMGKVEIATDYDFISALKLGLPRSAGMAIGLDRLIMFFQDAKTINETLFFPASEEFGGDY